MASLSKAFVGLLLALTGIVLACGKPGRMLPVAPAGTAAGAANTQARGAKETAPLSAAESARRFVESIGIDFVFIPAGSFMMGSNPNSEDVRRDDAETPRHRVKISKPFYLSKTEVTREQWVAVMGSEKFRHDFYNERDEKTPEEFRKWPMVEVSWNEVQDFIRKLNAMEGAGRYRLPTEAEWEYACRAHSLGKYCFGDDESQLSSYAWNQGAEARATGPGRVAQFQPNGWGLYDMHGNAGEWVSDWYGESYYRKSPDTDPSGPSTGWGRVHRGGSWTLDAWEARCAARRPLQPHYSSDAIGFRLARSEAP